MKKLISQILVLMIMILAFAAIARAELTSVAILPGDNTLTGPARAVAFVAASTNLTGTVRLEAVGEAG